MSSNLLKNSNSSASFSRTSLRRPSQVSEFMPGGASYCPGVKTARNQRRQKAARSLPLRKNGQPPRFDAEDVRELAASKGCEEHKERRQQQMKEEADARTAALGTFADLGL